MNIAKVQTDQARYYNPSTGRWLSEDPIGIRKSNTHLYKYTLNNPMRFIDPLGLSEEDVQQIVNDFKYTVDLMTDQGLRTDPGWWNNFVSWAPTNSYLGCGEQADYVNDVLRLRKYDDSWSYTHGSGFTPFYHQWSEGTSSNPNDPQIKLDPHQREIEIIQR